MVAVVIPIVVVVVAVMMMPMPNHVDPPRHEQRGPVIECAPVWVVDGRRPQDHDPGYIWPRYAETDGEADARLRRPRRTTARARHSSCQEATFHRSPPPVLSGGVVPAARVSTPWPLPQYHGAADRVTG